MIINGVDTKIDVIKGTPGLLYYNQLFNESLTEDVMYIINEGKPRPDALRLLRLLFVMTGKFKDTTFENWATNLNDDFDVLEHLDTIIKQAMKSFMPSIYKKAYGDDKTDTTE